jgi:hypothetical protein
VPDNDPDHLPASNSDVESGAGAARPERTEPDTVTATPIDYNGVGEYGEDRTPNVPRPVNWRTLNPVDAEYEWLALNDWVNWLRTDFALPATIIPPYWHRHPELVWELSALHLHWLSAYDPDQHAAAPIGWLADFHTAQGRLREWVSLSGTRLDRDRASRHTTWPGEADAPPPPREASITNRDEDFVAFVIDDVTCRAETEAVLLREDNTDAW